RDLAIIIGLAIPIVALAHRVRVPPLVGFLLVGVVIGPHGVALIPEPEEVSALSEIGVVLLLFAVGLELSLSDMLRRGRAVMVTGGAQLGGMLGLAVLLGMATGTPFGRALFYGALAAMSSTAVVTKSYADSGELDTPHGREVVSILVFQDLCILPLILVLPLLGRAEGAMDIGVWTRMLVSLAVMTGLVIGGRFAIRRVLDHIVGLRDRELFTLCVAFFGIATALVSAAAGFSLAIGAFLAGLIISESEYGLQALSDVLPFRALFSGVFFTSIGMLLDLPFVLSQPLVLVAGTLVLIVVKSVVAAGAVLVRGRGLETGLMSGLSLAQVGEFSFVLAAVGLPLGLFAGDDYQAFLSTAALSMMATPFLIKSARPISESIGARLKGSARKGRVTGAETGRAGDMAELTEHAVVVGYGVAGRYLARMLQAAGIACAVVDQDAELVRRARADGLPAVYGDGTRHAMLERVACTRARIIVFAISSPVEERRGVVVAREMAPAAQIVVRTRYVRAIDDLMRLGANQVVVEEFEASLELFARALEGYTIPATRIAHELEAVRNEHYGLLRGTAAPDLTLDTLKHLGIHDALELVEVENGAAAVDENARTLDLRQQTGAIQVAVVRDGRPLYRRDLTFRYRPGDTTVLVGDREALDRASALFRRPPSTRGEPLHCASGDL
ncbi:MAG: cation:proton antiporter, partial [Vicinamibacterales bacterium]|nr:cation:proton antiporter [Vicinamibacterales bacterium]